MQIWDVHLFVAFDLPVKKVIAEKNTHGSKQDTWSSLADTVE